MEPDLGGFPLRKLLTSVTCAGMLVGLTGTAFAADNNDDKKKAPEPVPGDYVATIGPGTSDREAVRIIEKRLDRKANGEWGDDLTKELVKFEKRHENLKNDREIDRRDLAALRGREDLPNHGPLTDAQAWWLGLEPRPEPAPAPVAPATETAPVVEEETAAAPAPAPVEEESYGSTETSGTLDQIRQCESDGDYSAVSPEGYGGAYQFDQQTWQGVGGSGSPASAPPAEQDMRAQMLLEQSGTNPWPVCGG
jgi:hypothetical protein